MPDLFPKKAPPLVSPVTAVPGVTGTLPMPSGVLMTPKGGVQPSAEERQVLQAIGWTSGEIPTDTASVLHKYLETVRNEQDTLPVDPRKPPLKVETVDIQSLPPERQKELRARLLAALDTEKATVAVATARAAAETKNSTISGFGEAQSAADVAAAEFLRRDTTTPAPAPRPETTTPSETGAAPLVACPHCEWPYGKPDIDEPAYEDKMMFMHSVLLGDKPYMRTYPLFGGKLHVTFRTLTPAEVDMLYLQVYGEYQRGEIREEIDFWERLNQYRLMLQLHKYYTDPDVGKGGQRHELPDGYSLATNPNAAAVWVKPDDEIPLNETGMPRIKKHIMGTVLKTEHAFRVVNRECQQFNRLVQKLEIMVPNPNFWKPTEERP